jgi:hypothetical protein
MPQTAEFVSRQTLTVARVCMTPGSGKRFIGAASRLFSDRAFTKRGAATA